MIDSVVIADDLTGALETGCLLSGAGSETRVLLEQQAMAEWSDGAIVFDVESRHLSAQAAAASVSAAAGPAAETGARRVYLKIDSTLRGPIGSELAAFMRAWPDSPLVFTPAYPQFGRIVRGGRLFVHGLPLEKTEFARDRFEPAKTGGIVELIGPYCPSPVIGVSSAEELREKLVQDRGAGLYVCDAETDQELLAIRRVVDEQRRRVLLAGSAGLFRQFFKGGPRTGQAVEAENGLMISGSQHPTSLAQVAYAESRGVPVYRLSPGAERDAALLTEVVAILETEKWAILTTPEQDANTQALGGRVGRFVQTVMAKVPLRSLTVLGGDTTRDVLRGLGVGLIRPVGELLAGIPISKIGTGRREAHLVTKAGGFGAEQDLIRIQEAIRGGR